MSIQNANSIQGEQYQISGADYLYCLTENNTETPVFYGVQIRNPESGEILFALDDLSEDQQTAKELLKLLADEQVEPGKQSLYVIEDYLALVTTKK